jgi:hypothetical protein
MSIYLNDWATMDTWSGKKEREAVEKDFNVTLGPEIEILLASYTYENYSGSAFVLYREGEDYYEVNGSHCSCYGLEDQWTPENTDLKTLYHRVTVGRLGQDWDGNGFSKELKELLESLGGNE